jgi:hypothetical protein
MRTKPRLVWVAWTLGTALIGLGLGGPQAVPADAAHKHNAAFATCAKACALCQQQCDSYVEHCAALVTAEDSRMTRTWRPAPGPVAIALRHAAT